MMWSNSSRNIKAFLSTPSARRATRNAYQPPRRRQISIHALREEGDEVPEWLQAVGRISIHALREEGDISCIALAALEMDFYPRPPRGGRLPMA